MNENIVAYARGWIGTRFHHQGRLKKTDTHNGGVDCLGLLIGVAAEMKLPFAKYDKTNYSHYPDTKMLRNHLISAMQEIKKENIEIGDVLLLSVDSNPQHMAIVSDISGGLTIIHAYAPARSVVEHVLDDWWYDKIVAVFRI